MEASDAGCEAIRDDATGAVRIQCGRSGGVVDDHGGAVRLERTRLRDAAQTEDGTLAVAVEEADLERGACTGTDQSPSETHGGPSRRPPPGVPERRLSGASVREVRRGLMVMRN